MSKEELIEALKRETDPVALKEVERALLSPRGADPEPVDSEELFRLLEEAEKESDEKGWISLDEVKSKYLG